MNKEELLVSLCQEAIRIPSMSGHEKEVAGLLKKTMIDYGFDEVNIDKYGSVLGIIHGSRPGKTVLMDGHIDTVDVIDRDQWSHDPFAAEIDDGRIYGRGTSDMKGSVCAMITAAAQYAEDTGKDPAPCMRNALKEFLPVRSADRPSLISSSSARPPQPRSKSARGAGPRWWWRQKEKAAIPPIRKRVLTRFII